jgi:preprotein translocase subunit SecG
MSESKEQNGVTAAEDEESNGVDAAHTNQVITGYLSSFTFFLWIEFCILLLLLLLLLFEGERKCVQEGGEMRHVESKEDMFEDATDDIEENQFQEIVDDATLLQEHATSSPSIDELKAILDKTLQEKQTLSTELKVLFFFFFSFFLFYFFNPF